MTTKKKSLSIITTPLFVTTFIGMVTGIYLLMSSMSDLKNQEIDLKISAENIAKEHSEVVDNFLSGLLRSKSESAEYMSKLKDVKNVLDNDVTTKDKIFLALDRCKEILTVEICFILNNKGVVVGASNANERRNLLGIDHSSEEYYQLPREGINFIALSLDSSRKDRGIYFSHPLYNTKKKRFAGVMVIKQDVSEIENIFKSFNKSTIYITNENDEIFLRNDNPNTTSTKHHPREKKRNTIAKKESSIHFIQDIKSKEFLHIEKTLSFFPSWKIHIIRKITFEKDSHYFSIAGGLGIFLLSFLGLLTSLFFIARLKATMSAEENAQNQLLESENKYRSVVNSLEEGVFLLENDLIIFSNKTLEVILECSQEYFIGRSIFDVLKPINGKSVRETYEVSHQHPYQNSECELKIQIEPQKSEKIILLKLRKFHSSQTRMTIGTIRDITKNIIAETTKKNLEAQLQHASRLASIGILTASVAHELKNPMQIILMTINLLSRRYADIPELITSLKDIKASVDRMTKISDNLRTFSRKTEEKDWGKTDLLRPIQKSLEIYEKKILYLSIKINLIHDIDTYIWGEQIQIESVFHNLISNSLDAFENFTPLGETKIISIHIKNSGENQEISYEDNGPGISKKFQEFIFQPFHTTKDANKGTGLGLSITKEIILQHKGSISFESTENLGTRFIITLPRENKRSEDQIEHYPPLRLDLTNPSNGDIRRTYKNVKILLVDDEEEILPVIKLALEDTFTVVTVSRAQEAITKLTETNFDILISDVKMPEMDGITLLKKLSAEYPNLKRYIISSEWEFISLQKDIDTITQGGFSKPIDYKLLKDTLIELFQR